MIRIAFLTCSQIHSKVIFTSSDEKRFFIMQEISRNALYEALPSVGDICG